MKKLSTLFKKDPNDLGRVINEINPENNWVFGYAIATRKFDGTACAIIKGEFYKRFDSKLNKKTGKFSLPPEGAIPCQDRDAHGHQPFWVKVDFNSPENKWHIDAYNNTENLSDGTYEACGPAFQKNPEKLEKNQLIRHGDETVELYDYSYEWIKNFLSDPLNDIEGIVFHGEDGQMCKIRKKDFGIKR